MSEKEYIDRKAFVETQRNLYCANCERRKGTKNGKVRFVYEIGGAPCRACDIGDMLYDVEGFPAADVRPVVHGTWEAVLLDHEGFGCRPTTHFCSECHHVTWFRTFFCPNCGADMREERGN